MTWQDTPYNLALIINTLIAGGVALYIWARRSRRGALAMGGLMLGAALWALCYTLEVASVPLEAKLWFLRLMYGGIVLVPAMLWIFALQYTGQITEWSPRLLWLAVEPLLVIAVLWSGQGDALFWDEIGISQQDGYTLLAVHHGIGFWLHAAYSYVLLIGATLRMLRAMLQSSQIYRRQFVAVLAGLLFPWLANAVSIFGLSPFPHLDLTPFAFTVTGVAITWGLLRLKLLDLVPVARHLAVEHMRDGVVVINDQQRVVDANEGAKQIFAGTDASLIGPPFAQILAAWPQLEQDLDREGEATWTQGEGEAQHTYQLYQYPLGERQDHTSGHLLVFHDITAQLRTQNELRRLKEAAEEANEAKSRFLANVSHELRTPMNAIIGMTELVLNTRLSDGQRSSLETVGESADDLLHMLNGLLDFAKIESGQLLELEALPFSLRQCLGNGLKGLAGRTHAKGLELTCSIPPDLADQVIGDATRLRQVVVNLVGNAIKFTEAGEIALAVNAEEETDEAILIRFAVRDTGIGIAQEQQQRIFEPFTQADASTTRRYGGTGLGLSIARDLVAKMDGRIWIDSEVGEGSTFFFTARFGRVAAQGQDYAAGPALGTARALLVESHATGRRVVEEILDAWGMDYTSVASGAEALARSAAEPPFDLHLVAASLNDMDGPALVQRLAQTGPGADARTLFLTTLTDLPKIEDLDQDAKTSVLVKPVSQGALLDALNRLVADQMIEEEEAPAQAAAGPALHILVVDDLEPNRRLVSATLKNAGHRVTEATNGREALARYEEADHLDLILMDEQMPEMDGLDATAAIRKLEAGDAPTPILALTAHAGPDEEARLLRAGMDGYLAKPFKIDQLLAAVARHGPPRGADEGGHGAGLDPTDVMAQVEGDVDLLRDMIETMETTAEEELPRLAEGLARDDAPAVASAAHALKGVLGLLGENAACTTASTLEDLARSQMMAESAETGAVLRDQIELLFADLHGIAAKQQAE